MLPLTLLAAQKLSNLLTTNNVLTEVINTLAAENAVALPAIASNQIILTSAGPDIADR